MKPTLPEMKPLLRRAIAKIPQSRKHRLRFLALLLTVCALVGAGFISMHSLASVGAASSGWPMYLHDYSRTAAGTDTTISPTNASQLTLNWAFKTGGPIASSATVVGGTVYVGSWDGYEYALNAATGAVIWKTFLGQTVAPCYPTLAGVSSGADVENGVLYVGGGDSNWYALDPTTGNVLWKVFVGDNTKGWYNWASPLIYNGYAYVGTASVGDCPLVPGQLLQISLSTHQVVNSFNFVPSGQFGGGVWTTPALDPSTNTVFVTTGTRNQISQTLSEAVVALDATTLALKSSWTIPISQEGSDADFGSSPILFTDAANDQLVAAMDKNGLVYAFNRNNIGAGPIWQQQGAIGGSCPQCGDGSASSGAFGNNMLYFGGGFFTINGHGYKGTVNALDPATGKYLWQHPASGTVLPALAYSNGLIFDGAGSTLEALNAASGARLWSYTTGGMLYAEPTIANGQVFTGGTDGYVYAFGLPSTIPPTPTPDPNCSSGWTCQDIGNPSPAGAEAISGNTWSVNAGGAGIGGTSDQFHFVSQSVSGDTQVSAQVLSQQTSATAAQAGLMVRQSSDPASPYYAVFLVSNKQLVMQYRMTPGGATTTVALPNPPAAPAYLEIQRVDDQFQAAISSDGVTYTLIPGDTTTIPMPVATLAGLATSSAAQGTLDIASYSSVSIQAVGASPNAASSPSPCPSSWSCADVGNPVIVGDQSLSAGVWTIKGAGIGIGTVGQPAFDQFHYVWQQLAGDGSVSAHITAQTNTNAAAQAGVMLRQSTDGASAYYGAFVTPSNSIMVQYRSVVGLRTLVLAQPSGTVPTYLMVARSGGTYCAYSSSDGANWTYLVGTCVAITMTSPALAGLAVTSYNTSTLSVATMDTVTVSNTAPATPILCPSGWTCGDIGYAIPPGSQSLSNGTWTVLGGGNDIYGNYDQFRFVSQALASDGTVSAHVTSQGNTDPWAKAGVMLRQSTDPGSIYYAVFATPGNGVAVQYRATQGGGSQQAALLSTGAVPTYLRVARSGSVYSAYTSPDGNNWTLIPGSSISLSLTGTIMAGIAVTSHNSNNLSTVTFDMVSISTVQSCPAAWNCADIGSPTPAGSQSFNIGAWTLQAGGADIYGIADQFHYVWQSMAGDGAVSARVVTQTNTSSNAKAGVMLRLNTTAGSPFYDEVVTPGHGVAIQYRKLQGGGAQQATTYAATVPAYVMVGHIGTTFSAYTSSDGVTWTLVSGSTVTLTSMTGALLAGLAATSHNTTSLGVVTFDTVSMSTCPPGWNCSDIGNPAVGGSQSESAGTWTITTTSNDIWGTSDQFRYVWQQLAGDGNVSARVVSQTNDDPWAKAGVMLRQSSDPGSPYYFAAVTPSNGIVVQYRTTQAGGSMQSTMLTGTTPTYLMVARSGTNFTTYTSSDGVTWTPVLGSIVTINMTGTVLAGLAATSHNSNFQATDVFDTVSVNTGSIIATCPTNWTCSDIGSPALIGSQTLVAGTWTIQAGGTDIYGTSDQFHYVYQSLAAGGSVSARVVSQSNSNSWAKAGVMIRQDNTAGSAYYFAAVTPSNGIVVQYRTAQGVGAQALISFAGTVPTYLAVNRTGTTFTTYTSSDGVTWTAVAGSSVTINMTGSVLAGLAVTSHNASVMGTGTFDTVNVGTAVP